MKQQDFQGGQISTTLINAMIQGLNRITNISGLNALGTATLTTSASTTYVDVTNTSISWTKLGDSSGSDVFVAMALSCYVSVASVQPQFGIKLGATDYDVTMMTINPTGTHTGISGFRVISGVAAGPYAPLVRFRRGAATAGNTSIDTGDTVSFLIGEIPR